MEFVICNWDKKIKTKWCRKAGKWGLLAVGIAALALFAPKTTRAVEDDNPPQITYFDITPKQIDTSEGDQVLTLTMTMTDDWAGVCISMDCGDYNSSPTQVRIRPLISTQTRDFYDFTRISGDDKNGTYVADLTIPQGSKVGVWEVVGILAVDKLGNYDTNLYAPDSNAVIRQLAGDSATIANTAESSSVTISRDWSFSSSTATVNFPSGTVVTKSEGGSFAFYQMANQSFTIADVTTDGLSGGTTLVGKVRIGIPGLNLSFSQPVTIELNVDSQYNGQSLEIKSLEEGGASWANETTCLVSGGKCSFTVDHASYFAAVSTGGSGDDIIDDSIEISSDAVILDYNSKKKKKTTLNIVVEGFRLHKKKSKTKVYIGGRKAKVQRVRLSGDDSIVRIKFRYGKLPVGDYDMRLVYRIKENGRWRTGSYTVDDYLNII